MTSDSSSKIAPSGDTDRAGLAFWGVVGLLTVVGLWLRVRNLGQLGLAVDEGIQALAVEGILRHGVPLVDGGAVYSRALSFLYLQAGFVRLFGSDPFWLRIPAALWGAAAIPVTYLLGRAVAGRRVGLLAAAFIALSSWEIELSRYARFYTGFQTAYAAALLFFFLGFLQKRRGMRTLFLAASLLAFFSHHLSIGLVTCFAMIPFLRESWRDKLPSLAWLVPFGAVLLAYREVSMGVRALGLGSASYRLAPSGGPAPGLGERIKAFLGLPDLAVPDLEFLRSVAIDQPAVAVAAALVAVAALLWAALGPRHLDRLLPLLAATVALAAAATHQFGIALTVAFIWVLAAGSPFRGPSSRAARAAAIGCVTCFVIWAAAHLVLFEGTPKEMVLSLFGSPDMTRYLLYWLALGWPLFGLLLVVGSIWLLVRWAGSDRRDPGALFLLAAGYFPALVASSFPRHQESRYFFHLYPVFVVIVAIFAIGVWDRLSPKLNVSRGARGALVAVALLAFFLATRDANPVASLSVSERDYATAKDPVRSVLNWPAYAGFHQDLRSPGLTVAERRRPEDVVVACGPIHMLAIYHLYAGGVDYTIAPASWPRYYVRQSDGPPRNYLTGSRTLVGVEGLDTLLHDAEPGSVWFLCDRVMGSEGTGFYSEEEAARFAELLVDPVYVGEDGVTVVTRPSPPEGMAGTLPPRGESD